MSLNFSLLINGALTRYLNIQSRHKPNLRLQKNWGAERLRLSLWQASNSVNDQAKITSSKSDKPQEQALAQREGEGEIWTSDSTSWGVVPSWLCCPFGYENFLSLACYNSEEPF